MSYNHGIQYLRKGVICIKKKTLTGSDSFIVDFIPEKNSPYLATSEDITFFCDKNKSRPFVCYKCFSLCAVKRGEGFHLLSGKREKVREGDVFLITPFSPYKFESGKIDVCRISFLPGSLDDNYLAALLFSTHETVRPGDTDLSFILECASRLFTEDGKRLPVSRELNKSLLLCILTPYLRKSCNLSDFEERGFSPALRKSLEYICMDFRSDADLSALSKIAGVSTGRISEVFSEELGIKYTSYLSDLKLSFAGALLTLSDISSSDISEISGFSSPSYFSSAFREKHGMSPLTFRRINKH